MVPLHEDHLTALLRLAQRHAAQRHHAVGRFVLNLVHAFGGPTGFGCAWDRLKRQQACASHHTDAAHGLT